MPHLKAMEEMRIVAVDDRPDNLYLLEHMLDDAGFSDVHTFTSAQNAFAYLRLEEQDVQPDVDLILMDIMMPGVDGIEACRRIKAVPALCDCPVIMVTAKDDPEDLRTAFEAGAVDYVTKPMHEVELLARVRSALALKQEMDCRKAREAELENVNQRLANSLERVHSDIVAAGKIQRSLLPAETLKLPGLKLDWRFQPSDAVGGDLLNAFPLGDEDIGFYLLDVSGHGIQAALLAVSVSRLLFERNPGDGLLIGPTGEVRAPDEVMNALNQQFEMDAENTQYFTITYGVFNKRSRILRYTQAGHPPLLVSMGGERVRILNGGDMPVGMIGDAEYHTSETRLHSGSRLFLYSDGIIEAENNRQPFGQLRLIEHIQQGAAMDLGDCTQHIITGLKAWLGDGKPQDDISLLALEVQ
ncbi:MAG: fused response regulator/phosphatase [Mariprofundaceae bacterium]